MENRINLDGPMRQAPGSSLTRRTFGQAVTVGALSSGLSPAAPQATTSLGEPVRLLGSRLAFTGWQWVRPGGFAWVAEKGGRLQDSVAPGEARVRRVDGAWGIKLITRPAEHSDPLLLPEKPWEEGVGVTFTTLIKEKGLYRAWSLPTNTSGRPKGQRYFTYFESEDGWKWKRPRAGIYDFEGSRDNNILNTSTHDYTKITPRTPMQFRKPELISGTVFIDPSAPSAQRYKVLGIQNFSKEAFARYLKNRPNDVDFRDEEGLSKEGAKGLAGATSPDGLHWSFLPDPLVIEPSDTHIVTYFDERLRQYVAYTRKRTGPPRAEGVTVQSRLTDPMRRCVGRSATADFRRFPVSDIVLEISTEHSPGDELYTNGRTSIPNGPDHHLMFPALWSNWNDSTQYPLATSADGIRWQYLPGAPVLGSGPVGAWDGGCVFTYPSLTELADGSWVLPYAGYNVPHKYPRGLWKFAPGYARWPDGRLVGLHAEGDGGFTTVAILPAGRTIALNTLTSRSGAVRVEVAGMDGKPLPGRSFADCAPIMGDHRPIVVGWGGTSDLGHREGDAIILRFRLEQASLYWVDFIS